LLRLADYLELVVDKPRLEPTFNSMQFRRNFVRLCHIVCHDQAAPNYLRRLGRCNAAQDQRQAHANQETGTSLHRNYLAAYSDGSDCKPSTQRTVTLSS